MCPHCNDTGRGPTGPCNCLARGMAEDLAVLRAGEATEPQVGPPLGYMTIAEWERRKGEPLPADWADRIVFVTPAHGYPYPGNIKDRLYPESSTERFIIEPTELKLKIGTLEITSPAPGFRYGTEVLFDGKPAPFSIRSLSLYQEAGSVWQVKMEIIPRT